MTLLDTKVVNQQVKGSQWNVVGQYSFTGLAEIRIMSTGGGAVTIADAARFRKVGGGSGLGLLLADDDHKDDLLTIL